MPEFNLLLEKYLRNELDAAELRLFLKLANDPQNLEALRHTLHTKLENKTYSGFSESEEIDLMFEQMLVKASDLHMQEDTKTVTIYRKRYKFFITAAAAAVFIILTIGAYLWFTQSNEKQSLQQVQATVTPADVAPGSNKAILTLSDGSTINLNDAGSGTLARQGNAALVKQSDGELVYHPQGKASGELLYNTMTTPRGGQFKLTLPDGTRVWLNASSSIRYPAVFNGAERKVTMTGEAYFEVAHNKKIPFTVEAGGTAVHVTGTHFNVNAYEDESATKTTLLEGAVSITKGTSAVLLKPGQQVTADSKGLTKPDEADTDESVAWKNGLFSFNGADLPSIMRQLARWYDLEVTYEGTIPKRLYTGKVFRNLNLSETLKVFELSHIHFRIEGKRLTVTP